MKLSAGTILILEQKIEERKTRRLRCRIADVLEKSLLVDLPVDESTGKTAILRIGSHLQASCTVRGEGFLFPVRVQRRVNGKIPAFMLAYEGQDHLTPVQRRNFVRVETNLDIAVHSVTGTFSPFVTLTSDIGGGGALIIIPENVDIQPEEKAVVWIVLPRASGESSYVRLNSTVIRVFTDKKTNGIRASLAFHPEHENERQPVIRYCFEKQLEQRKKMMDWMINHAPE